MVEKPERNMNNSVEESTPVFPNTHGWSDFSGELAMVLDVDKSSIMGRLKVVDMSGGNTFANVAKALKVAKTPQEREYITSVIYQSEILRAFSFYTIKNLEAILLAVENGAKEDATDGIKRSIVSIFDFLGMEVSSMFPVTDGVGYTAPVGVVRVADTRKD